MRVIRLKCTLLLRGLPQKQGMPRPLHRQSSLTHKDNGRSAADRATHRCRCGFGCSCISSGGIKRRTSKTPSGTITMS